MRLHTHRISLHILSCMHPTIGPRRLEKVAAAGFVALGGGVHVPDGAGETADRRIVAESRSCLPLPPPCGRPQAGRSGSTAPRPYSSPMALYLLVAAADKPAGHLLDGLGSRALHTSSGQQTAFLWPSLACTCLREPAALLLALRHRRASRPDPVCASELAHIWKCTAAVLLSAVREARHSCLRRRSPRGHAHQSESRPLCLHAAVRILDLWCIPAP